jgi:hypothetical protein
VSGSGQGDKGKGGGWFAEIMVTVRPAGVCHRASYAHKRVEGMVCRDDGYCETCRCVS